MKCCNQAKLAFPAGGVPYCQRASLRNRSPPQSLTLKGGLAIIKSAFKSLCASFKNEPSAFHFTCELSIPRIARFIFARRQVVWLDSCPYTEISLILPW